MAAIGWRLAGVKDGDSTFSDFLDLFRIGERLNKAGALSVGDVYVRILLVRVYFILIVGKGASLVFVATVAVNQDIAAKCLFVFYSRLANCPASSTNMLCAPRPFVLGEPTWRRRSLDWYREVAIVRQAARVALCCLGRIYRSYNRQLATAGKGRAELAVQLKRHLERDVARKGTARLQQGCAGLGQQGDTNWSGIIICHGSIDHGDTAPMEE